MAGTSPVVSAISLVLMIIIMLLIFVFACCRTGYWDKADQEAAEFEVQQLEERQRRRQREEEEQRQQHDPEEAKKESAIRKVVLEKLFPNSGNIDFSADTTEMSCGICLEDLREDETQQEGKASLLIVFLGFCDDISDYICFAFLLINCRTHNISFTLYCVFCDVEL
jgi:hypothetical protein